MTPAPASRSNVVVDFRLEDRFRLRTLQETREVPVYELVTTKSGHKLRISNAPESESELTVRQGRLIGKNVPLSQLAGSLSLQFGRTVIDKTGLSGRYDFEVSYTPEARDGLFGQLLVPDSTVATDPSRASIFTALQEQLGLKLESGSVLEVLVIDGVQMPTEN